MTTQSPCPCGTQKTYEACCGQYHKNIGSAPTAEALMRSRYTAFALNDMNYIRATQRLENAPDDNIDNADEAHNTLTNWIGLDILATQKGQADDKTGTVTFRARFQEGQHKGELSEKSNFQKEDGKWLYVSGEHDIKTKHSMKNTTTSKQNLGRNDPCFCGSGKKFKKCCG